MIHNPEALSKTLDFYCFRCRFYKAASCVEARKSPARDARKAFHGKEKKGIEGSIMRTIGSGRRFFPFPTIKGLHALQKYVVLVHMRSWQGSRLLPTHDYPLIKRLVMLQICSSVQVSASCELWLFLCVHRVLGQITNLQSDPFLGTGWLVNSCFEGTENETSRKQAEPTLHPRSTRETQNESRRMRYSSQRSACPRAHSGLALAGIYTVPYQQLRQSLSTQALLPVDCGP